MPKMAIKEVKQQMTDKKKRMLNILLAVGVLTITIGGLFLAIILTADTTEDIVWFFILLAIFTALFFTITSITEFICRKKTSMLKLNWQTANYKE
jgi:Kef-type K+ transport system membrane component KefB